MNTDKNTYDLIIAGGGIAGSMAAIAAAREGVRILLVEEQGFLGGSLTACGTGPMMTFHAGSTQVIRGIPDELIERLKAKQLSVGHIPDSTGYTYTVTPFDAEGLKYELELMMRETGVTVLYHASIIGATLSNCGKNIESVTVFSCGHVLSFTAPYFIDATGDADLAFMVGAPCVQGRAKDGKDQPMTMNFKLYGVEIPVIRTLMEKDISLFPFLSPRAKGLEKTASRLSCSGFMDIMKKARADGEISFDRDIVLFFETNNEGEVIVNMTRVLGENPVDPFSLSRAETEGRRQMWELYAFLKNRIPGFKNAKLISSGPHIGIRSSRRIEGLYTLTAEDVLATRQFEDTIARCGYPIDVHSPDGKNTDHSFLADGEYYSIPYRCLISRSIENLLAAGRIISCEFEAHASLRVSPCAAAIGQAAGTAAAIACKTKSLLAAINPKELRTTLIKQGAYI